MGEYKTEAILMFREYLINEYGPEKGAHIFYQWRIRNMPVTYVGA